MRIVIITRDNKHLAGCKGYFIRTVFFAFLLLKNLQQTKQVKMMEAK